jgi:uncharacterized protein (TIGR04222 family)
MAWVFKNPIAEMWGPYFLAFYALIFVVLLGFCWWHRSRQDPTVGLKALPVPAHPEPYRLAYLRGGVKEVLRLATVDLYQRGMLEESKAGWFSAKRLQLTPGNDTSQLPSILRTVAEFYRFPKKTDEILQVDFGTRIGNGFDQWDEWIAAEQLRYSDEAKSAHTAFQGFMFIAFALLGLYKLTAALLTGRDNIWLLIVMMAIGSILLMRLTLLPRFTRRGRRYIEHLQTAFASLKKPNWKSVQAGNAEGSVATDYAIPVVAMAIFGAAALQGGPLDAMYHHYAQSAASGSSCGAGCGGGDGGCGGGGCGGCGGCGG